MVGEIISFFFYVILRVRLGLSGTLFDSIFLIYVVNNVVFQVLYIEWNLQRPFRERLNGWRCT